MKVTKRDRFEASHYLHNDKLTKEECIKLFGNCSGYKNDRDKVCHGHSYIIDITVAGKVDKESGFLINFKDLKEIIRQEVIDRFDHNCLNDIITEESYQPITVENMLHYIKDETQLLQKIRNRTFNRCYVQSIKMWETQDSWAKITLDVSGDTIITI